ncbi:RDD family protein [Actinoplanes sp. NEAU-A11]|uniref:RDD family protein n=1 Tax=Actinoplanes aureus TaxID=2792083 RepID=A0A931C9R0_9ACTN|nr:RDD family protein [Actinoplanes aureus]
MRVNGTLVNAEAVELDLRPARLGARACALIFDIAAQAFVGFVLFILALITLSLLPGDLVDDALFETTLRVVLIVTLLGYPTVLETLTNGRSVGKVVVGLRVIREDGGPIRVRHAFTRALVGLAVEWPGLLLLPLTWVVSLGTMLSSDRGRRLGDLAAGTLVVHVRRPAPWMPAPPMPIELAGWAAVADLSAIGDDLALAVRQYLSRAPQIREPHSSRLRDELASEVFARVTPPPPPGTQPWFLLAAVVAERRRRAEPQLATGRALTERMLPGFGTGRSAY